MLIVFFRVMIIYFTVLIFLRIMGKRQIGQMQPYEVVITLIIADLATVPMSDTNIPLFNGILPLAVLVMIHFNIAFLTRKLVFFRKFMSGKPIIVITPDGIDVNALKKLNMTLDDLQESLRQKDIYSFEQVSYAIIETNGKISVIPTPSSAPLTAGDLNIDNPQTKIPTILISDGKIIKENIEQMDISQSTLEKIIKSVGAKSHKDISVMCIDDNHKLYFQEKGKPYKLINDISKKVKI